MADPLRVLIVDDSSLYRKLMRMVVENIPDVKLLGLASTGCIALKKIAIIKPDVVLQDIEMPEMSGVETLEAIKTEYPDVEVVLVSGVNSRNADIVMEGLAKGAVDFVAKPDGQDMQENQEKLTRNLNRAFMAVRARRLKQLTHRTESPPTPTPQATPTALTAPTPHTEPHAETQRVPPDPVNLVGIGISTGGPQALSQMITKLPEDFRVPVLLVQHMPPLFTASLAKSLDKSSQVRVVEARDGETLQPGAVYIAPGGIHMTLRKINDPGPDQYQISLRDTAPVNSCKPSVDVLFESMAEQARTGILTVIMTGMGRDGREGVAAIRRQGGYCLTQTQETCVVYGMPQAIDEAQLSDEQVPLDNLAARIVQLVG